MKLPADPRRACRFTAADYGPAVVLLAVAQWGLWSGPGELRGSRVLLASGMVLAAVALAGRRRWPVPALLLTGAGVLVPAALGSYAQSGAVVLMLVVAVFACGRYARPPVGYLGLPLGVALALAGSALDPHETLGSSWKWSLNALWIFALGVWMRQAHDLVVRTQQEQQAVARMAAAEERLRVAQDLHDVLAHSLSVMVVQAEVADELLESDPAAARAAIDRVQGTGRAALDETRHVLGVLRRENVTSDTCTLDRLPDLVQDFRAAGLPVSLDSSLERPLSPEVDRVVYRMLQESLTNVLRHAGARPTSVWMRCSAGRLLVDVENEGEPALVGSPAAGGGNGLRGMRERIESCGGTLRSGPRPGGGFAVHAELPLAEVSA